MTRIDPKITEAFSTVHDDTKLPGPTVVLSGRASRGKYPQKALSGAGRGYNAFGYRRNPPAKSGPLNRGQMPDAKELS